MAGRVSSDSNYARGWMPTGGASTETVSLSGSKCLDAVCRVGTSFGAWCAPGGIKLSTLCNCEYSLRAETLLCSFPALPLVLLMIPFLKSKGAETHSTTNACPKFNPVLQSEKGNDPTTPRNILMKDGGGARAHSWDALS